MDPQPITDITNAIVEAIKNHATPRPYDWWILTVGIVGSLLASGIATVSTIFGYKMYKEQVAIVKKQATISEKQNIISEQQNDISLFENKYNLFKEIQSIKQNVERTKRFYEREAIMSDYDTTEKSNLNKKGINPIFLLSEEFKTREINAFCSIFAANVLIHRMSKEYIKFRRDNESRETKVSDVIFFLDKVNIEVDEFVSRISMIVFLYDINEKENKEIDDIKVNIYKIKQLRDANDYSESGIIKLKAAFKEFCDHISNITILTKLNKELEGMKNKVKNAKQ